MNEQGGKHNQQTGFQVDGLELSGLRTLVALSDEGSVLGAANTLGTSRGTVRRRLAQLEEAVGLPLHTRGAERVFLTTAGEVLVERTQALLNSLQDTLTEVHAAAEAPVRSLRVLAQDGLPPALLVATILAGSARNPQLQLDLDFSAAPLEGNAHQYDVVVHIGPPPERGFHVTRQLLAIPEILVASRDYLAAHGAPTTPGALSDHRLLSWKPPGEDPVTWVMADGQTLQMEPMLISSDIHLIRHMAYAGAGIARLLEAGVPAPEDASLVQVLPDAFSRTVPMRLLIPEGLHRTPRIRRVIRLLEEMGLGLEMKLPS